MLSLTPRLDTLERFGRALADPTRCRILLSLLEAPAYPAELADELGLGRANVSNHLACLRGCGLVVATPQGRRVRYTLADARLAHALRDLENIALVVDPSAYCEPADSADKTVAI